MRTGVTSRDVDAHAVRAGSLLEDHVVEIDLDPAAARRPRRDARSAAGRRRADSGAPARRARFARSRPSRRRGAGEARPRAAPGSPPPGSSARAKRPIRTVAGSAAAAWMRPSIRFMVPASRATSSPLAGTGTRSSRLWALISSVRSMIASTGLSARPSVSHASSATPSTSSGPTMAKDRASAVDGRVHRLHRRGRLELVGLAFDVDRDGLDDGTGGLRMGLDATGRRRRVATPDRSGPPLCHRC